MIRFAHELVSDVIQTDVVVIGAGACGLTLSKHLKRRVLVIDGGSFEKNPVKDLKYNFLTTGLDMNTQSLRRRLVGGAASSWAGRCIAFNSIDFEARPWIDKLGWPIGYEALSPYFDKAWATIGFNNSRLKYEANCNKRFEGLPSPEGVEPEIWHYAFERSELPLDPARHFASNFKQEGCDLLMDANAVTLKGDGQNLVSVTVMDNNKRAIKVKANHFVLACGCVEASRILLNNLENCRNIISPALPWLGKGFHQHILTPSAQITGGEPEARRLQKLVNRFRHRPKASYEMGLRVTDESIRRDQIGNISATFQYERQPQFFLTDTGALAMAKLKGIHPIFSSPDIRVEYSIEQKICPDNAITLSDKTDADGLRLPSVKWSLNELELRTGEQMNTKLNQWLKKNSLGSIGPFYKTLSSMQTAMRDSLHHMGGARMSRTATDGVVDENLSLHSCKNLSVLGGAVFPTGGHGNPTLTMLALSIRLAEHLNATVT